MKQRLPADLLEYMMSWSNVFAERPVWRRRDHLIISNPLDRSQRTFQGGSAKLLHHRETRKGQEHLEQASLTLLRLGGSQSPASSGSLIIRHHWSPSCCSIGSIVASGKTEPLDEQMRRGDCYAGSAHGRIDFLWHPSCSKTWICQTEVGQVFK